jgi:hypothetical protein
LKRCPPFYLLAHFPALTPGYGSIDVTGDGSLQVLLLSACPVQAGRDIVTIILLQRLILLSLST